MQTEKGEQIVGKLAKNNPKQVERNLTIATERLKGKTYREIGEQFGLSKATVHDILNDEEIRDVIETGTREMVRLVPRAVDNYEKLLQSDNEKIVLAASKDTLQATSVMPGQQSATTIINVLNQQATPEQSKELKDLQAFLSNGWEKDIIDVTPEATA